MIIFYPSKTSTTRDVLCSTLQSLGYRTLELLLTPLQFGIPNSRLRYYLLAKRRPLRFQHDSDDRGQLWRHIPRQSGDQEDGEAYAEAAIGPDEVRHYLDSLGDEQQYRISDKVLEKWGRLFDIVVPSARRTCCFTRSKWPARVQNISTQKNPRLYSTGRAGWFYYSDE